MDIITSLTQTNRWWITGKIDDIFLYKTIRSEFEQIKALLGMERILSVIGPRRVGKSTLLLQTINFCLESGVEPGRILRLNADDPTLFWDGATIYDVIETYASEILHENLNDLTERIYIFIDEIHVLKDWQVWLKYYFDRKLKIKFIISGSSAAHLFEGSKESLLGRIESVLILPLSFTQFADFWNVYRNDGKIGEFLSMSPSGSAYVKPEDFYNELTENHWRLKEYKPYVNKVLKEYLLYGGYPEYFTVQNGALWQKRLVEDNIGQGLYRDIINVYNIKNPERLERLLYFVAANNGQDFNFKTIGDTINCDGETVSGYLSFLERAYFITVLNNYSSNAGKTIRKNRKLYVLDNGIVNALLRTPELSPTLEGGLIESCCVRDARGVCENNFWRSYYWREDGGEVDIVIDKGTGLLPVEVKYRNDPEAGGLNAFANKFKLKDSVRLIITKDLLDKRDNTISIPFWLCK